MNIISIILDFLTNLVASIGFLLFSMVLLVGLFAIIRGGRQEELDPKKDDVFSKLTNALNPPNSLFEFATSEKTLSDIAGIDPIVEDIRQVIDFIENRERYQAVGARLPKGILLTGQPGTGKTLIAKAIAGELKIKLIQANGSEFVEKFVGVGASRIRTLFAQARSLNEPVIIFIDEIEILAQDRGRSNSGSSDEHHQTLNQLLVEMDGIGSGSDQILVLGATNRIEDLDSAILRPGRFDRQLYIPLPSKSGRNEILQIHSQHKPLASDVDLARYADRTTQWSGAELANLVNEAALSAAKRGATEISSFDFDLAWDRIVVGLPDKSRLLSEAELMQVAVHETGHAIVGHLIGSGEIQSLSVIPNTNQALGVTAITLKEKQLMNRQDVVAEIATLIAGQVAEELACDYSTNGASDDLARIRSWAEIAIKKWGLTKSRKIFLTDTEEKEEISELIQESKDLAFNVLTESLPSLKKIAAILSKEEQINREQFLELIMDASA